VRDAQARVRLGVPTHARSNHRRNEKKKTRGFPPKEAEKDTKQESIRKKVHLFLSIITTVRRKSENCFAKTSSIRNKRFIFALEQTQLSLFPPHCGVHIAQNRRTIVLTISAHAL
jgi:hypothetical protein